MSQGYYDYGVPGGTGSYSGSSGYQSVGYNYGTSTGSTPGASVGGGSAAYAGYSAAKTGGAQGQYYTGGGGGYYAAPSSKAKVSAGNTTTAAATAAAAAGATTPVAAAAAGSDSTYSGYDAAVYAAATSYLQSKQGGYASNWMGGGMRRGGGWGRGGGYPRRPRGAASMRAPQEVHYCEVCKISCGGEQTYKAHLEGQRHKKKEAAQKAGIDALPLPKTKNSYRCELCDVTCTGQDTYTAHIRGVKHTKTVKLHQQLGKPVPDSSQPTVIPPKDGFKKEATLKSGYSGEGDMSGIGDMGPDFDADDKPPEPVGEDYVELVKDEAGHMAFRCKLCECTFTDLNSKDIHLKGRRHRTQYKKKVDPSLYVEQQPNMRRGAGRVGRTVLGDTIRMQREIMRMRQNEVMMRAQYEAEMKMLLSSRNGPAKGPLFPQWTYGGQRHESMTDRHAMGKHNEIYPTEEELSAVQKIVTNTEKALKAISDGFATESTDGDNVKKEEEEEKEPETKDKATPKPERLLKGVMRVGALAKGLLLRGDLSVQIVVLCSAKPTRTLLKKIFDLVPKQLEESGSTENYDVQIKPSDGCIYVISKTEPKVILAVSLTSVLMREAVTDGTTKTTPGDVLNKTKCLEALAALRHAKWFQARCSNLQSCLVVLRVMRDLCKRVPTWTPLSTWALELVTEKAISSAGGPVSPGEGFRRIFETVASGILLLTGPGLMDPCEKEPLDAVWNMSAQQREDITASAQHALRLVSFNQAHKVLAMEPLLDKQQRKRPRDTDNSESNGKQVKTEG